MVAGKRTGAAKKSRHTKKYWRKGTNVEEIEDSIHAAGREKATGGMVADMKDDDIFVVDRSVNSTKIKVSKRQQAALDKITKAIDKELVTLPVPKKIVGKIAKLPRGNAINKNKKVAVVKGKTGKKEQKTGTFDVWATDLTPKVSNLEDKEAAEHYLRTTKRKMPNTPGKKVTSLLPAVQIAEAGASYNPEAAEYMEYVAKVVVDEQKLIDQETKIKRGIEPQWEKIVTEEEQYLEMTEGLKFHPKYDEVDEEEDVPEKERNKAENKKESSEGKTAVTERLTKDQKKKKERAAEVALEEKRRLEKKAREVDEHNVYRTKQIHKELEEAEKKQEQSIADRRRKRVMDKLTKRQKLGRGEFKEEEDPFLLQEELSGNLRQLRPQGHVLDDRMKSLQRRNMLPIGGDKAKKLKKTLKRKFVEKRSVKEVTKGSRVI